jgi:hypothetical protein
VIDAKVRFYLQFHLEQIKSALILTVGIARKQKCNKPLGFETCRYCQNHGIACVTTQVRKYRVYEGTSGGGNNAGNDSNSATRIALLECLVKGLVPEADLSTNDDLRALARTMGIPLSSPLTFDETAERGEAQSIKDGPNSPVTDDERLLQDTMQGKVQYVGPGSSYFFMMKLRALFGRSGPNKGSELCLTLGEGDVKPTENHKAVQRIPGIDVIAPSPNSSLSVSDNNQAREEVDSEFVGGRGLTDALVDSYFEHIHADYPVLHESSFREAYERWLVSPSTLDRAWLLSFLSVLILARRVASVIALPEHEEKWINQANAALQGVLTTSSVPAVQGLMLFALHLQNTNNRDACWITTGCAIRIAFAIGLHRDGIGNLQTPLAREVRKRLWWTLCSFEQMQVSSHDRPSAIENAAFTVGCPKESILDLGGKYPTEYMLYSNQLVALLGQACRALGSTRTTSAVDAYAGPLSPATALLRDLERWSTNLPSHLSVKSVDVLPPTYQRPLLLLHLQYHYTVCLVSRSALLSRVAALTRKPAFGALPKPTISAATACTTSGRTSSSLVEKLAAISKTNGEVWWDVYYNYSATLILVLNIICDVMSGDNKAVIESRKLLGSCAGLAHNYLKNPMVPATLRRWSLTVTELDAMADEFVRGFQAQFPIANETEPPHQDVNITVNEMHHQQPQQEVTYMMNGATMGTYDQTLTVHSFQTAQDNTGGNLHGAIPYHHMLPITGSNSPQLGILDGGNNTFAPWTQLQFVDLEGAPFWGEVQWDDISNMLLRDQNHSIPDNSWH